MSSALDNRDTAPDAAGSRLLPMRSGTFTVRTDAAGRLGALLARCVGLRAGTTSPGSLTIHQCSAGERWHRDFGSARRTTSIRQIGAASISERLPGGPELRFAVALDPTKTTVIGLQALAVGSVTVPAGHRFDITAHIAPDGTTDVTIRVPGATCHYCVTFGVKR